MDKPLLASSDLVLSGPPPPPPPPPPPAAPYQAEPLTPPRPGPPHHHLLLHPSPTSSSSSSSSSSPLATTATPSSTSSSATSSSSPLKPNQVGQVLLYGAPIVSLVIEGTDRLCLAQISNTLLKRYSYNEIHNRRVALGITCVQCTPVQLEILRRAGAMPVSSRRCGMITRREAERLCKSFLGESSPPKLPDNFAFDVSHACAWGCRGSFVPARYNSSRAKCIKCALCCLYFSPNKFIFHSHRTPDARYTQPDAANFNSWRRHLRLSDKQPAEELLYAWEDVKAMFNGGSRKRALPPVGGAGVGAAPGKGALLSVPLPHHHLPHHHHHLAAAEKRARYELDELDELEATGGRSLSPHKPLPHHHLPPLPSHHQLPLPHPHPAATRSYPLVPVPSKGFGGVLHKFPPASLFPSPYAFPAFGLCQQQTQQQQKKNDDSGGGSSPKGAGLSGLLWPGRKDAFYSPFCMLWPPRAAGGLPLPTYLQPPAGGAALASSLAESPALRQAFLDLSEPGGGGGEAAAAAGSFEGECLAPPTPELRPLTSQGWLKLLDGGRRPSYGSAFRPVVKDAEGGGAELPARRAERRHRLSPGGSSICSYEGVEVEEEEEEEEEEAGEEVEEEPQEEEEEEEEGEVDVESSKQEEEEGEGEESRGRSFYADSSSSPSHPLPRQASPGLPLSSATPDHREEELQRFKTVPKSRDEGLPAYAAKDPSSTSDENKEQSSFFAAAESETPAPDYWREGSGEQSRGAASSPVPLKKDVENMEKEELQKVLLEQIDFRRRLEQEFHVLKGTSPFPVFHNFQDQMKRELAYREEMVQQLQMIPYANIIRKEKISSHINK
ncbi:SKI family transcriptional corepressor 2 [Nelusetta ayraudi]|uniref:SKI family transcriptional corepressor 2 n=1 Tax=Nelusetta ayraudi TaxID=303726 RepID=UPI003F6EDAB2